MTIERFDVGSRLSEMAVHNGTVYMIGPNADLIAVSSPPHNPATLAADFLKIRDWHLQRPERPVADDRAAETAR